MTDKVYKNYRAFYPFYLSQHSNATCRRLHYLGTSLAIALFFYSVVTQSWLLLWALPVCGYFFAWLGHFVFEGNKPATFTYPLWSLIADFHMLFDFISGRLPAKLRQLEAFEHEEQRILHATQDRQ